MRRARDWRDKQYPGALIDVNCHSLVNDDYWHAMYRANYYAWAAHRGFPAAGNDPLTGRAPSIHDARERSDGRAIHSLLARRWLERAAELRTRYRPVLPR